MDASGNPRGNSAFSNTDSKVALLTPKVVQAAKDHFTCSSLTSAAIEDNGGSGACVKWWQRQAAAARAARLLCPRRPVFSHHRLALP
jgi:hypothetical protein